MWNALCAVTLSAAPAIEAARAPVDSTLAESAPEARAAVAIVATPTSFAAHNVSLEPKLLCFRAGDATRVHILGAGSSIAWSFARQQLLGVTLEIYDLDMRVLAGQLRRHATSPTNVVALDLLAQSGADALWFTQQAAPWVQFGRTLLPGGGAAHLLKSGGDGSAALHVPVPAPSPRPRPLRPITRPRPI